MSEREPQEEVLGAILEELRQVRRELAEIRGRLGLSPADKATKAADAAEALCPAPESSRAPALQVRPAMPIVPAAPASPAAPAAPAAQAADPDGWTEPTVPEADIPTAEKIRIFRELFTGRTDVYATRWLFAALPQPLRPDALPRQGDALQGLSQPSS